MNHARVPANFAVLAFPESAASGVYGMYDVFMSAGRDWGMIVDGKPGPALIRPYVVSAKHGPFIAANGVRITPDTTLEDAPTPEIVCVLELLVAPDESLEGRFSDEIVWLQRCYAAGATLATACSGALLLAEAGLLDGHETTTHWAYCDVLARRYPGIKIRPQCALVVAGEGRRLVMAGGGASWLDLALYLIARTVGVEVAMQTARVNLIDWHDIGQQPFARLARSRQVDDAVIARCRPGLRSITTSRRQSRQWCA
jgi:transcriptional regulator GlxA family with amidase domain